jgi:ribosome-interacting GTPase 1
MPANLTPEYLAAEKAFRAAKTTLERIACLEEMLAVMPKHKGTDHLRADLRTKIAKLTQSLDKKTATQRATMIIEKAGAAQVAVIGPPNVGKSQIVAGLTKATPAVAAYPFTTQAATPGMMAFENIQIQLIDTPPLSDQPAEWWLVNIIKRADGLLLVVALDPDPLGEAEMLLATLREKRIGLGAAPVDAPEDEDAPVTWKKALLAANKADVDPAGENFKMLRELYPDLAAVAVSAVGPGLDQLRLKIFEMLGIIRVYTKTPGGKPDMTDPIILEERSTLEAAAASVHKDFARKLKYARIWGSGKHDGVMARRDHVLQDGDIIELHV